MHKHIFFTFWSNRINESKTFCLFYPKKTYLFLFYTITFTKYPHRFIYSKHLFNKIFILLYFLLFPSHSSLEPSHSLPLSLTGPIQPKITKIQPPSMINLQPPSTHTYHQPTQPPSMRSITIFNPPFIKQPSSKNPNPKKSQTGQIHYTWNPIQPITYEIRI